MEKTTDEAYKVIFDYYAYIADIDSRKLFELFFDIYCDLPETNKNDLIENLIATRDLYVSNSCIE